jgi:hypothetical protein
MAQCHPSSQTLSQFIRPSSSLSYDGTLDDSYIRKVPLPRASRIQITAHVTSNDARDLSHVAEWLSDFLSSRPPGFETSAYRT